MITLKSLFSKDREKVVEALDNKVTQLQNPNDIQNGETYHHWGKRICGNVNGNVMALVPFLQNVYNYIYRKQADNVSLQEQRKNQIQTEITICNNNISYKKQNICL